MEKIDVNYVIQVVDKYYEPGSFSLDYIPDEMFKWEIGGITDPIGQLINWLWSQIWGALTAIRSALEGFIRSSISALQSIITSSLSALQSAILTPVNFIASHISGLLSSFSALQSFVSSIFSGITSAITHVGATLSGIVSAIQSGISSMIASISTIISRIEAYFSAIRSFFEGIASRIVATITDVVKSFSTFVSNIQTYLSNFAQVISGAISQIYNTLQSFATMIGNSFIALRDWLVNGFKSVSGVITQLSTALGTFFTQVFNALKQYYDAFAGAIKGIPESISRWWSGVEKFFSDTYERLAGSVKEVQTTLMGFVNPLIEMANWFKTELWKVLYGIGKFFVEDLPKYLGDFWNWLVSVKEGIYNFFTKSVPDFVSGALEFFKGVPDFFKGVIDFFTKTIPEWFGKIGKGLEEIPKAIIDGLAKVGEFFVNIGKSVVDLLGGAFDFLRNRVIPIAWGELQKLGGFIWNALKGVASLIVKGVSEFFELIREGILWLIQKIAEFGSEVYQTIVVPIINGLISFGKAIPAKLGELFSGLVTGLKATAVAIAQPINEAILWTLKPIKDIVGLQAESSLKQIAGMVEKGVEGKQALELLELLLGFTGSIVGSQYLARGINLALHYLATPLDKYGIMIQTGWRHKVSGRFVPLGVGLGSGVDADAYERTWTTLNLGAVLRHLAREVKEYADEFGRGIMYGWAIWASQPISRLANALFRNVFIVELPPTPTLIEATRRFMPTDEFKYMHSTLQSYLRLYGYRDEIINWISTTDKVVSIKDRFNISRNLPIGLIYDLPSMSDFARMMVKDIFASLDDFAKAIAMRGVNPDTAYMYYLLHYRYPPPEKLWEFYCRAKAGILWYKPAITEIPELAKNIGKAPRPPIELNLQEEKVKKAIEQYMKWHDYAPFAWIEDFTSDRWIMIELMADIPTRIDVRWMYKWGLADDEYVRKIVIARGLHPDYVDKVAKAEMMNALAEERTVARTGVLNVYERGFMSKELADKTLTELTKVRLLGEDVPVKFLEGERNLLLLRSTYDRAYRALDTAWDQLVRGYYENVFTKDQVVSKLEETIREVNSVLQMDLNLDKKFIYAWLKGFEFRHELEIVERIRSWMRTFTLRVSQLAEAGIEVGQLIEDYAKKAKLTDEEKELIKELSDMYLKAYRTRRMRTVKENIIKGKLKRGEISIQEAISALKNLGYTDEEAQSIIEAEARVRTVSTDKLISMMEYVPVPIDKLKEKMNAEGVPPDEQALYLPYAFGKEVSEEVNKIVSELVTDYVNGVISEETLKSSLDDLATWGGQVKKLFGVDWIILSPQERQFIIYLANLRKARKLKRR